MIYLKDRVIRLLKLLTVMLFMAGSQAAIAFTPPPNFIGTTYEGCRNDGTIILPIAGKFICPDAAYTSGNLGKGWNELDLVPFHLITSAGNSAGPATTYNIYIAADYRQGTLGYDFISVPTVNPVSDASCAVSAGPQIVVTGITGGTDDTAYRELTITQNQGATCRFDWYQRLALGAAAFSGSNLQAYIFDQADLSGGKRTIPIPAREISPQTLAKDMTASQGSDHAWNLIKSSTPTELAFGDVCRKDAPTSLPVAITVTWTKFAAVPGGPITVITHVYATNPAARVITTTVVDKIFSGTTLLESVSATKNVPAHTANYLMLTHTLTVPAGTTDLNDVATATYTDTATGIEIPGSTQAVASATVLSTGPELNISAAVADTEQMTGTGLTFSVAKPSIGAFTNYTEGTPTTGPVIWAVAGQTDSGSVTFNKTIYLNGTRVTTGTLSDSASLVGIDGFQTTAGPLTINITSTATSKLTINKTYTGFAIGAGEKLVFSFHVSRAGDATYGADRTITLEGGGAVSGSAVLTGLTPDVYTVMEGNTVFYPVGCTTAACALVVPIQDTDNGATRTVHLETVNGLATCATEVSYVNKLISNALPNAAVQKVTVPASSTGSWVFTLRRPDGSTASSATATANASFVNFGVALDKEGTYTVTETLQPTQWDLTSASPNNGTDTKTCSFTVNFPQDAVNKTFQCTFTNTQRGKARVVKTEKGVAPTQAFTFQLRSGASLIADGTTLEYLATSAGNGTLNFTTWLVPGSTYQLCEVVMPGWSTTLGTFVPGSFMPPDGLATNPAVDNSILCGNFTVAAGETKVFTIDNTPPPGGRALTIGFWKNWASCKKSGGGQKPVLDQTMAKAEPTGIQVNSFYLHGSVATPNVAPDCAKAVNLLSKQNFAGVNKASDPLFNMSAQLVAAELNLTAGAGSCPKVATAVNQANALLTKYSFNGTGYTGKLSAADATLANGLATRLDNYNNNRPSACL